MNTISILAAVAVVLFGLTVAAAQKVTVDVDRTVDFHSFKTYGWSGGQVAKNPAVAQLITSAIERELMAKGLRHEATNPDLSIAVMAATGIDLQGVGPTWNNAQYKSWGGYGNPNALMNITNGTLLIDLVETKNNISVLRGVASDTLDRAPTGNVSEDAKHVHKLIDKAVKKIFKKYPV